PPGGDHRKNYVKSTTTNFSEASDDDEEGEDLNSFLKSPAPANIDETLLGTKISCVLKAIESCKTHFAGATPKEAEI
ncbi:unnamed protein product, partial [Pylaiella littoralis]